MNYKKLSGQALKCMYAATALSSLLGLAVLGALNYFLFLPQDIVPGRLASLFLAFVIFVDLLFGPWLRYHRYRYGIDSECIDIREGYLFKKREIVPIERLHKLQTARGPLDQFFGVAKVIVTTAGGDVTIRFLEETKAEEIADTLRRRINQIAAEQRDIYENTH